MEYRMKCDVCGNIFCYTDEDLKKNSDNAKMQAISALGGLASAIGGSPFQTHHLQGQANLHGSKIVDYKQCPHCHSRSISVYTGGDVEQASTSAATAKSINTSASAESLLKRAFMFLEDEEWETADAYCEACLDKDPELAEAYLGKLLAELHVKTQAGLKDLEKPFDDNSNYKKAIRFANDKLKNTLSDYIRQIHNRNEDARKDDILFQAKAKMNGNTIFDYEQAIPLLASIAGWKDADEQKDICQRKLAKLRLKAEEAKIENARLAEIKQKQAAEEAIKKAAANKKRNILLAIVAVVVSIMIAIGAVAKNKANQAKVDEFIRSGDHHGTFYYREKYTEWYNGNKLELTKGERLEISSDSYYIEGFDTGRGMLQSTLYEESGTYDVKIKRKSGKDVFYIICDGRQFQYDGYHFTYAGRFYERSTSKDSGNTVIIIEKN